MLLVKLSERDMNRDLTERTPLGKCLQVTITLGKLDNRMCRCSLSGRSLLSEQIESVSGRVLLVVPPNICVNIATAE